VAPTSKGDPIDARLASQDIRVEVMELEESALKIAAGADVR
jgi:hypothetical protein